MANIKLTDQFGLDVSATPAPTSALLKYFQQLPGLKLDSLDLGRLGGLTLDAPAVRSLNTGLSFSDPVSLGDGAPTLAIAAGAHASIRIIDDVDDLPGGDASDESPKDICYLAFGVEATASAAVSATAAGIQFGAKPSTKLTLESYSRFPKNAGVTLLDAVRQTVCAFALPMRAGDLADLPAGQIVRVSVDGKLELSGAANLLAATNPLASLALPAPLPTPSVSAGGSVTAGVSFAIDASYEIVARKLDRGAVRLGWHRREGTEVAVHVRAGEGITAGIGSGDLFSQVISAISANPKLDVAELTNAGLSEDESSAIQQAVKAAVNRKLEVAIGAEVSTSDSHSAAFLYEIAPAALTDDSRSALDSALRGNLTPLHAGPLAGITCVRSIWENVRKGQLELDVNLLGILNYRSVATLALAGKVLYEPVTGALTITDSATAGRIQSLQVNFGADTAKLRRVLAESFLITAAYHGAHQVDPNPSLRCSHSFFDLQNSTSRCDIVTKLQTGVALGLLSTADAAPAAATADFGRTLFSVSADYDSGLVTAMFLDSGGSPRPIQDYETAGRAAILALVAEDADDAIRRKPAQDDSLWNRMKDVGQPSFPSLFLGIPAPLVNAVVADYSVIMWWAEAMHNMSQQLAAMRHPMEDAEFQKQREKLASLLRGVAANTREEFGQPWGLIAMHHLTARDAGAKFLLSGPMLVVSRRSQPAAAIGR